jgi:hypothetical protein
VFTEPAATRAIAAELVITEAAVNQHFANLFDKFGNPATDWHHHSLLANDVIRRDALSISELRPGSPRFPAPTFPGSIGRIIADRPRDCQRPKRRCSRASTTSAPRPSTGSLRNKLLRR